MVGMKAWCMQLINISLQLIVLLMSKPFPYSPGFIGLFSCDASDSSKFYCSILSHTGHWWPHFLKGRAIWLGFWIWVFNIFLVCPSLLLVVQNWFGTWFLTNIILYLSMYTSHRQPGTICQQAWTWTGNRTNRMVRLHQ